MFSRIYQHQHWLSDEIPAAAIGYFVGNWVVDLHEGKDTGLMSRPCIRLDYPIH
jgi:hypothetical protein